MKKPQTRSKMSYYCMVSLLVCMILGYSIPISAAVVVTEDQTIANKFTRHTVTGITTPTPVEPDVTGFPGASYLTVGDIDGDGVKEIICTSGIGIDGDAYTPPTPDPNKNGAVGIFKRTGTGLDSWTQAVINQTFAFPNETVLRDMDGDGDKDIMVMDNFIVAWFLCGKGGIYWLENLNPANILDPANWVKHTIYLEPNDGTGTKCMCASFCPTGICTSDKCNSEVTSYHRARFVDLDGDGREDFVTTHNHMWYWQWTTRQYTWMEWFKKETDLVTYPSGYSGPHPIGDGGGFLFEMTDIDADGNLDIVAPQFFIYTAGLVPKLPGDTDGDSMMWFRNPGTAPLAANPNLAWERHTIDNGWTSSNPVGKGDEVVVSDIDNDGKNELVMTNHQHQQYSTYSGSSYRYWPAGVYYFEIPADPTATEQWTPISIETGDPNLDPNDHNAVLADVYGVDRDFDDYNGQGSPGMVRAQDITGDGYSDMLVPGDGKGKLYYYESGEDTSAGGLTYNRATLYADIATMPGEARFEDIDGDGDMDVVAAFYDTRVVKNLDLPITSSSIFIFENTTPTLIELASFEAQGAWARTILSWTTATEIDNAGFNIYRSETADGKFVKLNAVLIAAKGSATEGASYSFVDWGTEKGKTYYYKLEDIDLAGKTTLHGPASARPWFILSFFK